MKVPRRKSCIPFIGLLRSPHHTCNQVDVGVCHLLIITSGYEIYLPVGATTGRKDGIFAERESVLNFYLPPGGSTGGKGRGSEGFLDSDESDGGLIWVRSTFSERSEFLGADRTGAVSAGALFDPDSLFLFLTLGLGASTSASWRRCLLVGGASSLFCSRSLVRRGVLFSSGSTDP